MAVRACKFNGSPMIADQHPSDDRFNCERVLGMDTCKSLLLICTDHAYLLDGFQVVKKGNAGNFVRRARQSSERVVEVDEMAHDASAHAVVQRYVFGQAFPVPTNICSLYECA